MNYVTDTHPLIWSLFAVNRLSPLARDLFARTNQGEHRIIIPAVVIAESIMVIERRRVDGTVAELLQGLELLQATGSYQVVELMPNTVIASHALTAIPDIFDRLIVAEAQQRNMPLITRDTVMIASGSIATIWDKDSQ